MTVAELRTELVKKEICTIEEANQIKGKSNLLALLEGNIDLNELEEIEDEREIIDEEKDKPNPGTKQWTEYILSHCTKDELQQGHPTCDGLRRLAEKFIGEIVSQKVLNSDSKILNDFIFATVTYEIKIIPISELANKYINLENIPIRTYVEVADCWLGNTPKIFAVHPSATASTRAEGRCYRKALKLTVLTAEEMNNDNNPDEVIENLIGRSEDEEQLATNTQKILIQTRADLLDIDINKLVTLLFERKYPDINFVSRSDAGQLIKLINEYQTNTKKIPSEILKQEENK